MSNILGFRLNQKRRQVISMPVRSQILDVSVVGGVPYLNALCPVGAVTHLNVIRTFERTDVVNSGYRMDYIGFYQLTEESGVVREYFVFNEVIE